jgi:hypothetical protein
MGFDYDECSWQGAQDIDKEVIKEYESAVDKGDITRGVWIQDSSWGRWYEVGTVRANLVILAQHVSAAGNA